MGPSRFASASHSLPKLRPLSLLFRAGREFQFVPAPWARKLLENWETTETKTLVQAARKLRRNTPPASPESVSPTNWLDIKCLMMRQIISHTLRAPTLGPWRRLGISVGPSVWGPSSCKTARRVAAVRETQKSVTFLSGFIITFAVTQPASGSQREPERETASWAPLASSCFTVLWKLKLAHPNSGLLKLKKASRRSFGAAWDSSHCGSNL